MLFDADGKIKRYETPEQILQEFFALRLTFYAKRKAALLKVGACRAVTFKQMEYKLYSLWFEISYAGLRN